MSLDNLETLLGHEMIHSVFVTMYNVINQQFYYK